MFVFCSKEGKVLKRTAHFEVGLVRVNPWDMATYGENALLIPHDMNFVAVVERGEGGIEREGIEE